MSALTVHKSKLEAVYRSDHARIQHFFEEIAFVDGQHVCNIAFFFKDDVLFFGGESNFLITLCTFIYLFFQREREIMGKSLDSTIGFSEKCLSVSFWKDVLGITIISFLFFSFSFLFFFSFFLPPLPFPSLSFPLNLSPSLDSYVLKYGGSMMAYTIIIPSIYGNWRNLSGHDATQHYLEATTLLLGLGNAVKDIMTR